MGMLIRVFYPPISILVIALLIGYPFHSSWHPIMRFLLAAVIIYAAFIM
jgi:hypothetical protein